MNTQATANILDTSSEVLLTLLNSHASPEAFARALFEIDYRMTLATDPKLAEVLRACAIPSRFDAHVIGVLRGHPAAHKTNSALLEKLKSFSFVVMRKDGHYVYHDNTRNVVLEDWRRPKNRKQYKEYKDRLLTFYSTQATKLYEDQKYADMLTHLNLALEIEPKSAGLNFQLGVVHYRMQDYKAARVDFSRASKLSPKDGVVYHWLGVTNSELQNHDEAVANFSKAIRHKFDVPINTAWRGLSYLLSQRYKRALADLDKAIKLSPKAGNNYFWRGIARYHMGRQRAALTDFAEAIKLEPRDAMNHHWRGVILYELGKYKNAIADLSKSIKLDPKLPYNLYYRSLCYLGIRKYALARKGLDIACGKDPDRPHPLFWRGVARTLQGDDKEAQADWDAAAAIAQAQADLCEQQRVLAKLAIIMGDKRAALKHYRKALTSICKLDSLQLEQSYLAQLFALFPHSDAVKSTNDCYKKRLAAVKRRRLRA